jgi:hypothetical protein
MPFIDAAPREAYEANLLAAAAAAGLPHVSYTTDLTVDTLTNFCFWKQAFAAGYPTIIYSFPMADSHPNTPDDPADYFGNSRYGTLRNFPVEQAAAARLAVAMWDDLIVRALNNGTIKVNFRNSELDLGLASLMPTHGQEHRFSLICDGRAAGAGGLFALHTDGASVRSSVHTNQGSSLDGGGMLVFGQEQDSIDGGFNASQTFLGLISDARIFNTVRTASEIAANAFSELANPSGTDGLVAN